MKNKNKDLNKIQKPNFILCDMGVPFAFAQMCQNFQKQPDKKQDWIIIDNDTGEIIMPPPKAKT